MPPENWCGYCLTRSVGEAMPTSASSTTARDSASRREIGRVLAHGLDELSADGHQRVERGERILEDRADPPAAQASPLAFR